MSGPSNASEIVWRIRINSPRKSKGTANRLELGMKQGRQSGCKRKAWCSRSKGNRLQRRSETDVPSRKELNNISKKNKSHCRMAEGFAVGMLLLLLCFMDMVLIFFPALFPSAKPISVFRLIHH